ncbi:MAG: hypothetical protein GF311_19120 [Candidatus Lokiarchaeota archaeon]|nr:hypothetical protein [Candidatus Lokiarchaeota archaeon]
MKKREILKIIKALASERAPSGLENNRGKIFKTQMEKIMASDFKIQRDQLGNYYTKLKGSSSGKKIAIIAHIDEIGGTIRKVRPDGTLEFSKRGGYEGRWLISKTVQILNKDRKWVNGVICGRSTHSTPEKLRGKENIDPLDLRVYIGAQNRDDVIEKYRLHIGAPFVFSGDFGLLNPKIDDDVIAGYSMDNLAALTCLIVLTEKLVSNLKNQRGSLNLSGNVYIVASTREEIGTEGAFYFTRNHSIDKVIAIDIGIVEDASGTIHSALELHGGPVIVWQESRGHGILDYNFCRELVDTAENNDLIYQNGVFEFYGSDAGKTQKWLGLPSALIGIPTKFSHNVPEVSTLSGIEDAAQLIYYYLQSQK